MVLGVVAVFCAIVATILQSISCFTPYWLQIGREDHGLFIECIGNSGCELNRFLENTSEEHLRATQFFAVLALLSLFSAIVIGIMLLRWDSMKRNTATKIAPSVLCIFAAIFIIVGVIVFPAKFIVDASHIGWSLILGVVAAVVSTIAGILHGVYYYRSERE